MKNKTSISFLINILVGILFSFPVFSAQGNAEHYINSHEYYFISASQTESLNISDCKIKPVYHFSNNQLSDALLSILFKKNLTTCEKDDNSNDLSQRLLKDQFREYFLSDIFFKNPDFVNLSYLKELKTTKMLC